MEYISLRAEINAPQTQLEKKLSFPIGRESTAYRQRKVQLSRWAEINAPKTISEEKLSFPRMRESTAYRQRKVQLIMFTYLISLANLSGLVGKVQRSIFANIISSLWYSLLAPENLSM